MKKRRTVPESELAVCDLYLRITHADGISRVEHRRVWNAEACVAAVQKQYREEDAKERRAPTKVVITTKEDYMTGRAAR